MPQALKLIILRGKVVHLYRSTRYTVIRSFIHSLLALVI